MSARAYLANLLVGVLPPCRCYKLKAAIFHAAGYEVSRTCRVVSSARLWGGNISIGSDTFIGHQVMILGGGGRIEIGSCVDIGPGVCIVAGTHEVDMEHPHSAGPGMSLDIVIEDGVWIGARSTILGGVTLGRKCVIGAGSVVTRDVPPQAIAFGAPCKNIKQWDSAGHRWEPAPQR